MHLERKAWRKSRVLHSPAQAYALRCTNIANICTRPKAAEWHHHPPLTFQQRNAVRRGEWKEAQDELRMDNGPFYLICQRGAQTVSNLLAVWHLMFWCFYVPSFSQSKTSKFSIQPIRMRKQLNQAARHVFTPASPSRLIFSKCRRLTTRTSAGIKHRRAKKNTQIKLRPSLSRRAAGQRLIYLCGSKGGRLSLKTSLKAALARGKWRNNSFCVAIFHILNIAHPKK